MKDPLTPSTTKGRSLDEPQRRVEPELGARSPPPAGPAEQPRSPPAAAEPPDELTAAVEAALPAIRDRSGEEPAHPGVPLSPPGIVPESDVRVHSPSAAQPPHRQAPWSEDLGELPWGYGDGRLVALLRDPRTLFIYWDLSQPQVEQAFHGLGAARAVLKLWAGAEFLREIDVHLEARGWYARDLPPGADLRTELWAVGERGARMVRAARVVRLPPATPSNVWDEIYVTIPPGRRLGRGESLTGGQPLQWRAAPSQPPQAPAAQRFAGSSEQLGGGPSGGGSASGTWPPAQAKDGK